MIQDSTIVQLPAWLWAHFSGVSNGHATVCNVRLQGIYDLLAERFVTFSIDPYSRNDPLAAFDLHAEPGDLVLRDRGYYSAEALAALVEGGAHTVTRYKHKTTLLDPASGAPLRLLRLLHGRTRLDQEVLLPSARGPLRLRLIAVRVPEEIANRRRQKARRENKGHAPSQELLALMSWTILLTTLTDPAISFEQLWALYGLRWRIEIIFKTWKSHFHLAHLHHVSAIQARVLLLARLITITRAYERLFTPLARQVLATSGRCLSVLKFTRYLSRHPERWWQLAQQPLSADLEQTLVRYCTYDQRTRPNFPHQCECALAPFSDGAALRPTGSDTG